MTREGYGSALRADALVRGQGESDTLEAVGVVALADEVDVAVDVRPPSGMRYQLIAARERNM
jgi:hypothetical protein